MSGERRKEMREVRRGDESRGDERRKEMRGDERKGDEKMRQVETRKQTQTM